jgi:hypothetical protein
MTKRTTRRTESLGFEKKTRDTRLMSSASVMVFLSTEENHSATVTGNAEMLRPPPIWECTPRSSCVKGALRAPVADGFAEEIFAD